MGPNISYLFFFIIIYYSSLEIYLVKLCLFYLKKGLLKKCDKTCDAKY